MAQRGLGMLPRAIAGLVRPLLRIWTKRTWTGMEHIPGSGGVIIAANHLSHFDPLACADFVYAANRWPQFLAKASLFRIPVVGWLIRKVDQVPVERGSVEAAKSLERLVQAIERGGAVIVYPEGTTTREPDLWPMRGKTGAARLVLLTGAPVVPVAMWGPQRIFDPRTGAISFKPRTPVAVTAGPPVDLSKWIGAEATRATLDAMTDEIMLAVRDLLAGLRQEDPPPLYSPPARRAPSEGETS